MAGRVLLLVASLCVVSPPLRAAGERPLPDLEAFVASVKERLRTDGELQRGYTYTERQVEQTLDGKGRVKDQSVKVFEVYPPLPGEREAYRRFIEEDGRPVPAATLARRDRERRAQAERYARQVAGWSEADRQRAWRDYERALEHRAREIEDIFLVFDVQMLRRDQVNGHDTIVFSLTPRPKAAPRTDSGRMMRHFTALAWISESDYELVRVEVEAVRSVSFGLGLLGRLHKGATASFERRKVNDAVWLPARVAYEGSGRLLLFRRVRRAGSSEFFDYRTFSVDTSTTVTLPQP